MKFIRDVPESTDVVPLIAELVRRLGDTVVITEEQLAEVSAGRLILYHDLPRCAYTFEFIPFKEVVDGIVIDGEVVDNAPRAIQGRPGNTDGR